MSHDIAIIVGFTPPVSPSLNWLVVSHIFYTVIPGIIFSPLIEGYVSSLGGSTTNQFKAKPSNWATLR